MTLTHKETTVQKPLRLWPGVTLAIVQAISWFALPRILPEELGLYGFFATLLAALLILIWWLFFSRARWPERLGFLLLMIAAIAATSRVIHVSVAQTSMGLMFYFLASMLVPFAFVVSLAISRGFTDGPRRAAMAAGILLACGVFTLLRNEGVGSAGFEFKWRWSPTPEERLLAQGGDKPVAPPASAPVQPAAQPAPTDEKKPAKSAAPKEAASAAEPAPAAWPGYRGTHRDGIVPGVRIETNWASSPPKEQWRRAVGPGWSSFAVRGDVLYTQEQRGESEVVACYDLKTGKPVWEHRDAVRFWEANAGAGPRGTPTVSGNRVYAIGATGILNALDAATGAVAWSRNAVTDAGVKVPYWGISSSPLVLGDAVIVAASGRLMAYDAATGAQNWAGPEKRGGSYASPHLLTVDGIPQVVLLSNAGATSVSPADGNVLWEHAWQGSGMLQPAQTAQGDLLVTTSDMSGGVGTRRIAVSQGSNGWSVAERWTTRGFKPYFNDFVVHKGHAYGFDGTILACIELEKGERKWKGGRYGQGQMVLLPEQDLLLVLSEEGEVALVSATPDGFKEIARAPAIEGKTWNHPAVVGDLLLVRNDREMAAFRLPGAVAKVASTP